MKNKERVLILCTGNSCRSQMAEGLLRYMAGKRYEVFSAGTHPGKVHPLAIRAMSEIGIDISKQRSQSVDRFADQPFDHVMTVCDAAKEACPVFPNAVNQIHHSFEDPAAAVGSEAEVMPVFRRVRDEIKRKLTEIFIE